MLSAAAQREDRLFALPFELKGGAARRLAAKLNAAGLIREVRAKAGAPVWRRDAETEQGYALRLTAAGLKAAAVETKKQTEAAGAQETASPSDRTSRRRARSRLYAAANSESAAEILGARRDLTAMPDASLRSPRIGSKLDRILGMLAGDKGATLGELTAATGWLSHTARAALTGLRKRGYDVRLSRGNKERASVYRVKASAQGSAQ